METVMEHNQEQTVTEKRQQEYQEAIANGFQGTYQEYLQYRDYT